MVGYSAHSTERGGAPIASFFVEYGIGIAAGVDDSQDSNLCRICTIEDYVVADGKCSDVGAQV